MSKENLKRVQAEIKAALDTATAADITATDPDVSCIDADTFKQIARSLRRALRLISGKSAKPTHAEQDADLLFDAMNTGLGNNKGGPTFEFGCVLDDELEAAGAIYDHRHIFTLLYLEAIKKGKSDELKFILRELRKGTDPKEIASRLDRGRLK